MKWAQRKIRLVTANLCAGMSGLARPLRLGTDCPSSTARDARNDQRCLSGGRSRAMFALAFGMVMGAKANGGIGGRPLRRVEPHAERQRAQSNALAKCVLVRYMFPETWKDFRGPRGSKPNDADDGE
jgi:hypothetical protein